MTETAAAASDQRPGRDVAFIGYFPYADEAGNRIIPRIVRHRLPGGARRNLTGGIDPMVEMIGSGDEDVAIVNVQLPRLVEDAGSRSLDHRARCDIAVVGASEDDDVIGAGDRHAVGRGIDRHADHVTEARLRTSDLPQWRDVAVRIPGK